MAYLECSSDFEFNPPSAVSHDVPSAGEKKRKQRVQVWRWHVAIVCWL